VATIIQKSARGVNKYNDYYSDVLAVNRWVEITFSCLPLRSIPSFSPPVDASAELVSLFRRLRGAAQKHGLHNTYYVRDGMCVFRLTNHEQIGVLEFGFQGTVLTDTEDLKTLQCDLEVQLVRETCDWLVAPVVEWFADTVREAVKIEFDRFIAAGDLERTIQRLERLRAASDASGGFLGMGL
jgi:hypothetical protein